jgi:DNA repair protein RecO (recombination protein O)
MVTDEGVCIRQWDWSETSQTVSIFTRDQGVIRGIAKGSKRENARFSGGIEVMTRAELISSSKPTEGLTLLAAWDLLETFPAARRSLSAFYSGMTMLDLVHHALSERDPHPALYDALIQALRALGGPQGDRWALLRLLWQVLSETGHRPELERDASTGGVLEAANSYAFNARLGGLTADVHNANAPVWRLRAGTVDLLRALAAGAHTPADPASIDRATRLLALYFREVFACDLPSLKHWLDKPT